MKADTVKFFLDCYLKEDCFYDSVDGIAYSRKLYEPGSQSGESNEESRKRFNDFDFCQPLCADPQPRNDNGVQLNHAQEQQIRRYAGLLRSLSNDFEQNYFRVHGNKTAASECVVIQFKKSCQFVSVNSKVVHIPVVREGDLSKVTRVKWKTIDATAVSGHNYVGDTGEIIFAEEESEKMIMIKILNEFEEDKDYRFQVSLESAESNLIGQQNSLTVCIVDHDYFYDEEKQVVENIFRCKQSNISNVICCLHDNVTPRTFHTALQFICSSAHSVPEELALAFQLTKETLRKVRRMSLYEVVCDYFRNLPELENIGQHFEGFH